MAGPSAIWLSSLPNRQSTLAGCTSFASKGSMPIRPLLTRSFIVRSHNHISLSFLPVGAEPGFGLVGHSGVVDLGAVLDKLGHRQAIGRLAINGSPATRAGRYPEERLGHGYCHPLCRHGHI